ncbi:MAG: tetratricopeptide repeat protein [Defluviitaleaceae bacterium]|nr:tetratricopeptide repeat protein [Defluviitaleaceae bacterium]
MAVHLQFCVSQQVNVVPYAFKTTGIRVYSFEEVIYHVYHHWRESVDEFLSDKMIQWVAELGHSYLATKMKELKRRDSFAAKILDFLRLVDYFAEDELGTLKTALEKWELRREWEQLKERGDYFANRKEPAKAIPLYKRALQYDENAPILNNLGIQYLQTSAFEEGFACLSRAMLVAPNNFSILLHYIEAAILSGHYGDAAKALKKAYEKDPNCADIAFLLGLMSYEQKDYPKALTYFEKAIAMDMTVPHYVHKAAEVHLQMRQYEKALNTLETATRHDATFHAKKAEIYAAWNDIPRAVKAMTVAVIIEPEATNYAKLAAYHRQDYEPRKAEVAIEKALALDPENNMVKLENARIKKGLGHTREHQAILTEVLKEFRDNYRSDTKITKI